MMLLIRHPTTSTPWKLEFVTMPFSEDIADTQRLVGGMFESLSQDTYFPFLTPQVIGWCNDIGKLLKLPPTLPILMKGTKAVLDVVVGDILITGQNGPDTIPLTDKQIQQILEELQTFYFPFKWEITVKS